MTTYERIREIRNKVLPRVEYGDWTDEVSLNDILLMIGNKKTISYDNGSSGKMTCYYWTDDNTRNEKFKLNLTLPIKDQDEETLIKILSLIE